MKYEVNATIGTVVAGTGSPGNGPTQLRFPRGMTVDETGAVIVADTDNYRIQRFPRGSLVGVTIARNSSNHSLGLTRDMNIDMNNNIYLAEYDRHRILRYNLDNGVGVGLVGNSGLGSGAHQIRDPFGTFVDRNQTLYITDGDNDRIQMWLQGATNGTTVAGVTNSSGSSLSQLNKPRAVLLDNNGCVENFVKCDIHRLCWMKC